MTTTDIIVEIHKNGDEVSVYKYLSEWIVNGKKDAEISLGEKESIIKAIEKIAARNKNKAEAIDGIKALCEMEVNR